MFLHQRLSLFRPICLIPVQSSPSLQQSMKSGRSNKHKFAYQSNKSGKSKVINHKAPPFQRWHLMDDNKWKWLRTIIKEMRLGNPSMMGYDREAEIVKEFFPEQYSEIIGGQLCTWIRGMPQQKSKCHSNQKNSFSSLNKRNKCFGYRIKCNSHQQSIKARKGNNIEPLKPTPTAPPYQAPSKGNKGTQKSTMSMPSRMK